MIDTTAINQAIDETFANISVAARDQIRKSVLAHMMEYLKTEVFKGDSEGVDNLQKTIEKMPDQTERARYYTEKIFGKMASLDQNKMVAVANNALAEVNRVMHLYYLAINNG